jgi:hypothetical protein
MRTLRKGSKGQDVQAWLHFLRGRDIYPDIADRYFGPKAVKATKAFQKKHKLGADGVVGNRTYAKAMQLGFALVKDDHTGKAGPNWPPPPTFKPLSGNAAKAKVFGKFRYKSTGVKEGIQILDDWAQKNIVRVSIPQLVGVKGSGKATKFYFHRLAANQFQGFFAAVEKAGLSHLILSNGGSWVPRFIRGSRSILSNHSFGSAIDINVRWNYMGSQPALVGQEGSVRLLVQIAYKFGLYWGGHFRRSDGMHFEVAKLMTAAEVEKALKSVKFKKAA